MFYLLMLNFFALTTSAMTAVVNASFWVAVLLFIWKKCKNPDFSFLYKPIIGKLFLLFLLCFIISWGVNGDLASNNANEFYKDHLKHLVIFIIVADVCLNWKQVCNLVLALSAGSTVRALIIIFSYLGIGKGNSALGGFALDSVFNFTLTAGVLFFSNKISRRLQGLLIFSLIIQLVPLVLHGSRTPLIAITTALVLAATVGRYYRALFSVAGATIAIIAVIAICNPVLMQRYTTPFKTQTYKDDGSWKERLGIWFVAKKLIAEKPFFGYGPGWRKLSIVIQQKHSIAGYQNEPIESIPAYAYRYFSVMKYGRANTHSLYFQTAFELGFIGLFVYICFLMVSFYYAVVYARSAGYDERMFGAVLVALIAGYLVIGVTNGLMAGSIPLMFVIAALMRALFSEKNNASFTS